MDSFSCGLAIRAWWRFFRIYIVLFFPLLLLGGKLFEFLVRYAIIDVSALLFAVLYALGLMAAVNFGLWRFLLARKNSRICFQGRRAVWWSYWWRMLLLTLFWALLFGPAGVLLAPTVKSVQIPLNWLPTILGNAAMILGSLSAFMLLLRKRRKKQPLLVVSYSDKGRLSGEDTCCNS